MCVFYTYAYTNRGVLGANINNCVPQQEYKSLSTCNYINAYKLHLYIYIYIFVSIYK